MVGRDVGFRTYCKPVFTMAFAALISPHHRRPLSPYSATWGMGSTRRRYNTNQRPWRCMEMGQESIYNPTMRQYRGPTRDPAPTVRGIREFSLLPHYYVGSPQSSFADSIRGRWYTAFFPRKYYICLFLILRVLFFMVLLCREIPCSYLIWWSIYLDIFNPRY